MGMFDSVYLKCPECGSQVELQSKAGECLLINYSRDNVPLNIAEDLDGRIVTCTNGHRTIVVKLERKTYTLILE